MMLWIHTFSRTHPQSMFFAAILGRTIIGPVIEVQIVKILDLYGLELAIPSLNDRERTSYVMLSRGKNRFVDEIHIPIAELRSKCKITLWTPEVWRRKTFSGQSRRLANRRLVRSILQVQQASRKLVRTPSAFVPVKRLFTHKEPFLQPKGSGKLFLPILRIGELCE